MELISPMAEVGCGWNCIGICGAYCFIPPFYLIAISDDVAWACILADPR